MKKQYISLAIILFLSAAFSFVLFKTSFTEFRQNDSMADPRTGEVPAHLTYDLNEKIQYQNYCNSLFKNDSTIANSSEGADHPDLAFQQNFLMTMDPKTRRIPNEKLFNAIRAAEISRQTEDITIAWEERGPKNIGGRTRAIMIDPNDPDKKKLWAGSVSGGLWVNLDITDTDEEWIKVDDFWDNLAITSICYDPTYSFNFYVGTGEGWINIDAVHGGGIWKSSDGGIHWNLLANTNNNRDFDYVQKIAVHPVTGDVYACTKSWDDANRGGLMRSTDGGATWDRVLCTTSVPTSSITNRCADIEFTANNSIAVSMGIGNTDGIYISNTGNIGDWTPINNGIPANRQRIELATAPSDANIIYAAIEDDADSLLGVFKTIDTGLNWTQVATPMKPNGTEIYTGHQAWYNLIIAVHPTDPDYVYTGGVTLARSTNGGSSWEAVSGIHTDYHNIIIRMSNPNDVIISCDGGVYFTDIGWDENPSIYDRNSRYNVTQYYSVAMKQLAGENYFLGGTQDNGTLKLQSAHLGDATFAVHGDGGFCFIDNNSRYQFATYVHNKIYRSTNYGEDWYRIVDESTGRFINPCDYDQKEKILYSARDEFSIKLLRDAISSSYSEDLITGQIFGATPTHIKVSPYEDNTIYVGVNGGRLFKIEDANQPNPITTELTPANFPDGYISCIEFGESANQMLVTFSNYGITSVFESTDGGSSFISKEGDLPDMPVRWALYNPNNLSQVLLATEVGVWSTEEIRVANPHWVASNSGLANVRVDMLKMRSSDNLVIAATHGRGIFSTNSLSVSPSTKLLASDGQEMDRFGFSVATNGDFAIVGAPEEDEKGNNAGAVYFYEQLNNQWTESAKVLAPDGAADDYFGRSVDMYGDLAIVGASVDDLIGSAYIYRLSGNGWNLEQKITPNDGSSGDHFGASVAIQDDRAVVGAWSSGDYGAVYIFTYQSGNWVQTDKIIPVDGSSGDRFGWSIDLDANYLVAGSPWDDDKGDGSGSAYVYHYDNGWPLDKKITADDGDAGDRFGISVSIDNPNAVIGAYNDEGINGQPEAGSAYVFFNSISSNWEQTEKLWAQDALDFQWFGNSVSVFGDYILVGAEQDSEIDHWSGAAYVYRNEGNNWVRKNKLFADDEEEYDRFGQSVYLFGTTAIVSATGGADNGVSSGAAYIFQSIANNSTLPVLSVTPSSFDVTSVQSTINLQIHNNNLAYSMDWNAYSFDPWLHFVGDSSGINSGTVTVSVDENLYCARGGRIIVRAPGALYSPREVFIHQEAGPGLNEVKIIANDPDANDYFGFSVDVDGDYAIVGAVRDDEFGSNAGAAYIFERDGCCSWIQKAKLRINNPAYDGLGQSVAISGDVAIVGTSIRSKVFVFEKPIGGWQNMFETAKLVPSDGAPNQYFGHAIDIYGEYAIVGAPNSKKIFIYERPEGGWQDMSETFSHYSPSSGYNDFGASVAIYKNYAVVGSANESSNQAGKVYIFKRNWYWVLQTELVPNDSQIDDWFGRSVDIDANRIIVGAKSVEAAYIFARNNDEWSEEQKLTGITFGTETSVAIDGDYALVGGPNSLDSSNIRTGSAFSFTRNESGWSYSKRIFSSDPEPIAEYGGAVSISGTYTIISCVYKTVNGGFASGAAYIYCTEGDIVTSVSTPPEQTLPVSYNLKQNYPNPFNPATTIVFDLPKPTNVTLKIYTVLGEEVTTLVSEELKAGTHKYIWNPVSLASGIYLYRIESKEYTLTKKMVYLK